MTPREMAMPRVDTYAGLPLNGSFEACSFSAPGLKWPGLTTAQSLAVASQFAISLAVGAGLGLITGQWLDGPFHTGVLLMLVAVFAGLVAGITAVVAL